MSEALATPAPVTAPIVDRSAPLGKASEFLKTLPANDGAPVDAAPADGTTAPEDAEGPAEASLAARLIKKQRQLEKREAKFKADQAAAAEAAKVTSEAAASWQRFQDAKTKQGRVAALRTLFDDGEINGELYQELTESVYSSAVSDQPLSKKDVDDLVASKLEDAKKAEAEAAKKADEEKTQQLTAREQETSSGFVQYVDAAFNPEKFPTIARFAEFPELALTGEKVIEYTKECFAKDQTVPSAEDVLTHFEAEFRARAAKLAGTTTATNDDGKPTGLPRGVSREMISDSTPKDRRHNPNDLKASLEEAKREAGLIR